MNPSNGIWILKLFSKGDRDQLKIKLTKLKFPEHDNLDLSINLESWKYEEGISTGAKETGRQLIEPVSLGFSLGAIFDPFF